MKTSCDAVRSAADEMYDSAKNIEQHQPHQRRKLTMNTSKNFHQIFPARLFAVALVMAIGSPAWAGRPLSTDDAATADFGTCQIEAWRDKQSSNQTTTVAPACGVFKGVELGLDYSRESGSGERSYGRGLALKWVPESWQAKTAFAEFNAGVKFSAAQERQPSEGWKAAEQSALLMVSSKFSDTMSAHINLGAIKSRTENSRGTVLNAALVASFDPHVLLFIESQTNDRRAVFGPTVNTVGARFWVVPEKVGIDLTASRAAGSQQGTTWGVGFGWYGLSW
jgi:hypothetical protein